VITMRILVLGGTSFVGRHIAAAAERAGHDLTLFHRGRTGADLFPTATRRHGDRESGDYSSLLEGPRWDTVVDVSAYVPRQVEQAADALTGRVEHYVLVSSISAYDPAGTTEPTEAAPLHPPLAVPTEQVSGHTYGPLKADCERSARRRWEGRLAVVRPTYVVGPHDPTDRFTWWVRRAAEGGRLPVAGSQTPLQLVDVRDLGEFMLRVATRRLTGAYDVAGPERTVADTVADLVPGGGTFELVELPVAVLEAAGVRLPLVATDPADWPAMRRSGVRAREAGLGIRPLPQTAADTRAWDVARGRLPLRVGPSPEREAAALAAAAGA
jgi:nucleoside-diphosphate-sugar epimerase